MGKDELVEGEGRAGRGWDGRADGEGGGWSCRWEGEGWTVGRWGASIFSFIHPINNADDNPAVVSRSPLAEHMLSICAVASSRTLRRRAF